MYLKLLLLTFLILSPTLIANDVKIIDLHKIKSLDQLVLDSKKNNNDQNSENNINNTESDGENLQTENSVNTDKSINNISNLVTQVRSEDFFYIDENIIKKHLLSITNIKSNVLNKEFIKILSTSTLGDQTKIDNKIYFIIKKLYEIGEIGKAYSLIKDIDLNIISNKEYLIYFQQIELNYLFSTFQLSEACELKNLLMNKSITLPKYLLEKTDIFCLTLENKFGEAKLLNSLLEESETEIDQIFQNLFNYMILKNKNSSSFKTTSSIKSKELIFLYSAMLRINELPLYEDFISIDPLNLSIPVILSESTNMNTRIKAANRAFYDEVLTIDSLSALYQSVDFNSKDFSQPEQTILNLNNNKQLIMAFYYQLANIQIFPQDRLNIILEYWKFAKKLGLEKIAYSITKNIIKTFTPTSQNTESRMEIAFAHISNKNFTEATKWIDLIEISNENNDQIEYGKFLISLNESNDLDDIVSYLENNSKFNSKSNKKILETIENLNKFLNIQKISNNKLDYKNIIDDRLMPSYFLINDIKNNMKAQNDLSLFLLALISMNNKNWIDLHPEHLIIILNAYNIYDQGSLIKPIILEILNDLEII